MEGERSLKPAVEILFSASSRYPPIDAQGSTSRFIRTMVRQHEADGQIPGSTSSLSLKSTDGTRSGQQQSDPSIIHSTKAQFKDY